MFRRRRSRALLVVLALPVLAAGCGDDSSTGPSGNTLVRVSGDGQSAPLGAQLPAPLTVRVEDAAGDPVGDVVVTWALASAAGPGSELSSTSSTTGGDGQTAIAFTLGGTAGTYEVRASVPGSSVMFTATATAGSALEVQSGNGQVGYVGAPLGQSLVARAVGTGGNPAAGVEVTFEITESQGSGAQLSATTVTTGATGLASTSLTLGSAHGRFVVTASAEESSVQFTAHACGGDPDLGTLGLAPGEDVLLSGPAAVGCIQLPGHAAGAEYEVIVSSLRANPNPPPASMSLAVSGSTSGAGQVIAPFGAAAARVILGESERAGLAWRKGQYAFDDRLRQRERDILPALRPPAASPFGLMAVPSVGDTLDFGFSCIDPDDFPNAPENITGIVRSIGTRTVIVEDTAAQQSSDPFTQADFDAAAQAFDEVVYPTVTEYFGSPGDVDDNGGRVVILYAAGVNNLSDSYDAGFIAGFFCVDDFGSAFGNRAEMFYLMVPDPDGVFTPDAGDGIDKDFVQLTTDNTAAHEFQHLINAWRRIGASLGPMDVALNEGLSHLGEELIGHAEAGLAPGSELGPSELLASLDVFNTWYRNDFLNLATYLIAPDDTAALVTTSDPFGVSTFRMRGAAWGFLRYLLDRFDTAGTEAQRTVDLVITPATTMAGAVSAEFGIPFDRLATEWNAMFSVEDRTDLAGAPREELGLSSYRLREFYDFPLIATFVDAVLSSLGLPQSNGYPLIPAAAGLSGAIRVPAELYPATAQFVRLTAGVQTAGTGLRLQETASGADLATAVEPRVVIIRTK